MPGFTAGSHWHEQLHFSAPDPENTTHVLKPGCISMYDRLSDNVRNPMKLVWITEDEVDCIFQQAKLHCCFSFHAY